VHTHTPQHQLPCNNTCSVATCFEVGSDTAEMLACVQQHPTSWRFTPSSKMTRLLSDYTTREEAVMQATVYAVIQQHAPHGSLHRLR
jgi:hypothetical protein